MTGTDHRISSADHAQTNGLDECFNQTIQQALLKFVNSLIDSILFVYRTSKHDSTRLYNREARLPIDVDISSKPDESSDASDTQLNFDEKVLQMMQIRERVKSAAKKNIDKAQDWQKLEIGEKVFLRNSREDSRKGGKLKNP